MNNEAHMKRPPMTHPTLLLAVLLAYPLCSMNLAAADDLPADDRTTQRQLFSIHDLDRDGRLSREEYARFLDHTEQRRQAGAQAGRQRRPPLRFDEVDNNGNGYLNEDELISALNRRLERHRQRRNRGGRW